MCSYHQHSIIRCMTSHTEHGCFEVFFCKKERTIDALSFDGMTKAYRVQLNQ